MATMGSVLLMTGVLTMSEAVGFDQSPVVLRDRAFEVTLPPGVPLPTATKTADASGVDYSAETRAGVYRIQYMDMSTEPIDPDKLFNSIRNNVRAGMKIDSEETFTHQGHRGLRLFISMPNLNQVMRMDCIAVGKRLYRLWFIARTTAQLATPEVRAFFSSFRITEDALPV